MEGIVFLNGKFIPQEDAGLSVLGPGFLYGWGLFETMRSYNNKIVYFREHLQRIKRSCRLIDMKLPYSLDKLKTIIKKAVKINGFQDAYVRLTLWKTAQGTDVLVIARKYQSPPAQKYRQGWQACIFQHRQNENSYLAHLKTTNYLFYRLAYLEAKKRRFDEAVILNNRGYLTEGSRSNIFLLKDKQIFTPSLECGCLGGITRRAIFDLAKKHNIKISEGNFTLQDLYGADEAFFTNSLLGVMPLVSVEKQPIGAGRITKFFMKKYNLLLKNGN